ncbi:MAG: hypothetical protein ACKPAJ_00020, partial [Actinomycetota bacterium]
MVPQSSVIKPQLVVLDALTAHIDEIIAVIERDGGVIVHNMLTAQTVATMLDELAATTAVTKTGPKTE